MNVVAAKPVAPTNKDEYLLRSDGLIGMLRSSESRGYVIVGGHRVYVGYVDSNGEVLVAVQDDQIIEGGALFDGEIGIFKDLQIANLDQFYDANNQTQSSAILRIVIVTSMDLVSQNLTNTTNIPSSQESELRQGEYNFFDNGRLKVSCNNERTSNSAFSNNTQVQANGTISGFAEHYLIPGEYVNVFGKKISCN
ncbi:hypothetical protein HYT57_05665 [Candidatus Woesearchaeota archaeon]|nr:hypothetical protein [Candidatus Woesearchaeota archaeon]